MSKPVQIPGYHTVEIKNGVFGEISKIREELEELEDADKQGIKLMVLLELADMYGAMEGYLLNHHRGVDMEDIRRMSYVTQRAFRNGHRASK
jgi:hypothetical protein